MEENSKKPQQSEIKDIEVSIIEQEKYNLFNKIKKELLKQKMDFSFEQGKIEIAGDNFIYYPKDKPKIYFLKNSKYIYFINKQKDGIKKQYFIHDKKSFNSALEKTEIKNGVLKAESDYSKDNEKENYNSNNSNKSGSSSSSIKSLNVEDILASNYDTIIEETSIKFQKIFNPDNFNKRYSFENFNDLDFNFKYFKYNNNKIGYINEQNNWHRQLNEFYKNNINSLLFIFGPKGVGKTTLLLKYLLQEEIPRLYFSIKQMSVFNNKKWKKISLYESIYTFNNINEMNKFSELNQDNISNSPNLMEFIFSFIQFILNFHKNSKEKIFIIIDDYNDLYDPNDAISQIINYVNNNKNKICLCILGEGIFIRKKLYQYLCNININFIGKYWNLFINDEISKKDEMLKLPFYYYKYKNFTLKEEFKANEITKIAKYFNNIELKSFFLLNKYKDSFINIKELKGEFENLPLEFLSIHKKKDEYDNILIKLEFNLEIYNNVFEDSIKGMLKIENIKEKIKLFGEDNMGKQGIDFEDIIVEQFWNNTFEYINFPANNKLKIYEIYQLKSSKEKRENVDISKPIIIRQTLFKGKYYDLLLIIEDEGRKYGIFIQIGLNKTGTEISAYFDNISKYYEEYKEGIEILINYKIDSLGFLLIMDYNSQIKLKQKNNKKEGVGFCLKNNIDFLIYKNFELYKNLEDLQPIKLIKVTKNTLIYDEESEKQQITIIDEIKTNFSEICKNISEKEKSKPNLVLNENEKKAILDYIKKKYEKQFYDLEFVLNINKNNKGIGNFGIIDKDIFIS